MNSIWLNLDEIVECIIAQLNDLCVCDSLHSKNIVREIGDCKAHHDPCDDICTRMAATATAANVAAGTNIITPTCDCD